MAETGCLVWLASYPKSGNTWVRAFLTSYCRPEPEDLLTSRLHWIPFVTNRHHFDHVMGIPSSCLSGDEILEMRALFHLELSRGLTEAEFYKVHDAFVLTPSGRPLFPPEATRIAVYVIRNPLDLAVSYADHLACSIDRAIDAMHDEAWTRNWQPAHVQFEDRQLTWSQHVTSWLDQTWVPVLCLRYEDMLNDPHDSFSRLVSAAGLPRDEGRLHQAVEASSFTRLRAEEEQHGFEERPSQMTAFFRRGRAGAWCEALGADQVSRLIDHHGAVMRRFGYLDPDGHPTR